VCGFTEFDSVVVMVKENCALQVANGQGKYYKNNL
jgi:hypothetical protein